MTLQLNSFKIQIPYYNAGDDTVEYSDVQGGTLYDSNSGVHDLGNWIALFAFLNKMNPDWLVLSQNSTGVPYINLTGEGYIVQDAVNRLAIEIIEAGEKTDFWWGSNQFAKYGLCGFSFEGFVSMPITFVNLPKTEVVCNHKNSTAFYYNFLPGVKASITAYSAPGAGDQISTVPPIAFYDPGIAMPFMVPDEVPTNLGNAEVLP